MKEATAVKRAEEPIPPTKSISLLDQVEETISALARRAYDIFESNGRTFGRDLENWLRAERELLHPVQINITESDESLEVRAEVPGFSEKEIEIRVEAHRLAITGKRDTKKEETKGKTVYAEACSDQILRIVDLPADIEPGKVTATLKNGILQIILPKVAKGQPVQIRPKAA